MYNIERNIYYTVIAKRFYLYGFFHIEYAGLSLYINRMKIKSEQNPFRPVMLPSEFLTAVMKGGYFLIIWFEINQGECYV